MDTYESSVSRFFGSFESLLLDSRLLEWSLQEHADGRPVSNNDHDVNFAASYMRCFEIYYNPGDKSFDHPICALYDSLCAYYDRSPPGLSHYLWKAARRYISEKN